MTPLEPLFEQLAREQDRLRAAGQHRARVAARLLVSPSQKVRRRGALFYWSVAALGLLATLGGVLLLREPAALVARVQGSSETAPTGVWLGASESKPLALDFSDGTRVSLSASSQARIVSLSEAGAALELKQGRASLSVVSRKGSEWTLNAGPFGIRVRGTRFEVAWDPVQDSFEVVLEQGHLELSGCGFGEGRSLTAGQTARARCAGAVVAIAYDRDAALVSPPAAPPAAKPPAFPTASAEGRAAPTSDPAANLASAPTPATVRQRPSADAPVEPDNPLGSPALARDRSSSSWQALAQRGAYLRAFRAAEAAGFERQLEQGAPADLMLLGEVARHAGAGERAERAFRVLRERFQGTAEASFAAFALGRLQFDAYGSHTNAARWFRVYLKEQPGGSFAREALGRLLEATSRAQNHSEAQRLARRYLEVYPAGPHAELAARIAQSP